MHHVQEAKRIHEEGKVDYSDMAVLFRAFKCEGGRAHSKLQVRQAAAVHDLLYAIHEA